MRTVRITESFSGFPQGGKEGEKPVLFTAGEEVEVSNTFADLIVGKGHAREVTPVTAEEPAEKPSSRRASKE